MKKEKPGEKASSVFPYKLNANLVHQKFPYKLKGNLVEKRVLKRRQNQTVSLQELAAERYDILWKALKKVDAEDFGDPLSHLR